MSEDLEISVAPGVKLVLRCDNGLRSMEGSQTILQATEVFAGALSTIYAKDATYGGAWKEQGWRGNLARIMSKTGRLRHMLWNSSPLESTSEPVADTLQDLINLCVFMTLNRQAGNEWGR